MLLVIIMIWKKKKIPLAIKLQISCEETPLWCHTVITGGWGPWWFFANSEFSWELLGGRSWNIGGIVFLEFPCQYLEFDTTKRNAICSLYLLFFFPSMPAILCFQQLLLPICPSCLSSPLSCRFWFLGHLICARAPILVCSFGDDIVHVLMWHIYERCCHHRGTKYTVCFVQFPQYF